MLGLQRDSASVFTTTLQRDGAQGFEKVLAGLKTGKRMGEGGCLKEAEKD